MDKDLEVKQKQEFMKILDKIIKDSIISNDLFIGINHRDAIWEAVKVYAVETTLEIHESITDHLPKVEEVDEEAMLQKARELYKEGRYIDSVKVIKELRGWALAKCQKYCEETFKE